MKTESLPRLLLFAGFTAGFAVAAIGVRIPAFLALAPGIILFVTVATVIALSNAPLISRLSKLRVLWAAFTSELVYIVALLIYMGIANYMPQMFGFPSSDEAKRPGLEILVALIIAGSFAAAGMTFSLFILSHKWRVSTFVKLLAAALTSVGISCSLTLGGLRVLGLQATDSLAFPLLIFSLFPTGYALFSRILGIQLVRAIATDQLTSA